MAGIKAISYYLPEYRLTNDVLNERFPEWSIEKISVKTGIYERRIAAPDEFSSDMAVKSAERLFKEHGVIPAQIDFIILCTQSPDYFLPTTACIIQDRLHIPKTAGAFDFNLGCSGFVYGLGIAKGLIKGGMAKNVLLITSETYSKFIHTHDRSNLTIFGDAAACTLITEQDGFCKIDDFIFGTDGAGAENLIVKEGGVKYRNVVAHDDKVDRYGNIQNERNLFMNGTEIFNFTLSSIPSLVNDVLLKNNLTLDEINLFIFHQANRFMLNHLKKKIGIADDRFFVWMEACGNTVSSTIPIALKEALDSKKIAKGDKVLLAGFGVGYSWAGTILSF